MPASFLPRPLLAGSGVVTFLTWLSAAPVPAARTEAPPPRASSQSTLAEAPRAAAAAAISAARAEDRQGLHRRSRAPAARAGEDARTWIIASTPPVADPVSQSSFRAAPSAMATAVPTARSKACAADVGLASAYASRGINVFQAGSQQDVHGLLAPSLECAIGESGVAVGWLGAFQLSGNNAADLVAGGAGAENDVYVTWTRPLTESVEVSATATLIAYPLADADAAGVSAPLYVEPTVAVAWSGAVVLAAEVVYSAGLQAQTGYAPFVYVHPTLEKTVELGDLGALTIGGGAGWKGFTAREAPRDNVWDVHADLCVQKDFGDLYVMPSVHAAWTNLEGVSALESSFVWVGVNVGASL